ncbi:HAD-IC family P-type ATPase, partial [Rhodovulum adriaticum]|uniref:HAD-IC family P-type ATPase n=1 Tax=Rhodovulum adriaticum TaxID=35804 RepID=UPI0019071CC5
ITGKGVKGNIRDKAYYIGNDKLMQDIGIYSSDIENLSNEYSKQGKTSVYLFDENQLLAIFAIADAVKKSSYKAVKDIENMGIKTVMLTGDNKHTAKAIADSLSISEYRAELLPQDKDEIVEEYKKQGKVAMVGDGINDAPALANADIGISMGSGSSIAMESSDFVVVKNDLRKIYHSFKLSEKLNSIIL